MMHRTQHWSNKHEREESIGVWANVPEYHAKRCDGWTYDPMFGEWYTVA